jgi:serine/threonine protein kinase
MKNVFHQNCIQLYEVIEDKIEEGDEDEDEDERSEKLYMIMELAKYKEVMSWNENTYKFDPNPKLLSQASLIGKDERFICQKYIIKIIKDCIRGLAYLHTEVGIIHRDIKP